MFFCAITLIAILVATIVCATEVARFDLYRLYNVVPVTEDHVRHLEEIERISDSYTFIKGATRQNRPVSVIVAPHKFAEFSNFLIRENLSFEIVHDNLQEHIDDEVLVQTRANEDFGWRAYYPLENIYNWLDTIVSKYPKQATAIVAGRTYEGREIRGVKLSYKSGNPGIFIEGGIHAREWISPATATFLLNTLLTSKEESVREVAENYDWYIFPNTNPDGYVYTHKTDRLWRKTRQPYGAYCYGADPNRNWDFHWNEKGTSNYPCSNIFAGSAPFSEIEARTYSEYLRSLSGKLLIFIGLHSYSQLLLFPYGHTSEKAPNHDDMAAIAEVAIEAILQRYGTEYEAGNIYDTIYPASGASMDYAYGNLSIPLSYTYELRPGRGGSFELPASEIIETSEETVDSVVALVNAAAKLGYNKNRLN